MTGSAGATSPALCRHCGGPNPPGARSCQWCHATLPLETSGYRPLDPVNPPEPEKAEIPWLEIGLILVVAIMLVVFIVVVLTSS